MRAAVLGVLVYLFLAVPSADAAIINVEYTGTYSGTIVSGNPAASQFTTTTVESSRFDVTFVFNTLRPYTSYSDNGTSSTLLSFYGGGGSASGTFFVTAPMYASDSASAGTTSQSAVGQTISKEISNTPALSISVSNPDVPASITQPFSISNGLTGSGSYAFEDSGVFSFVSERYILSPQTITVSVSGVPEPSTWAMLLIGFMGLGAMAWRRSRALEQRLEA